MKEYDAIIIGAGPAGFTAAIYLLRAGRKVLIIEKSAPGGKLINIKEIKNWPGIESIEGGTLAVNLFSQSMKLGLEFEGTEVLDLKKEKNYFIPVLSNKKEIMSKIVIISTGLVSRKLSVPGIDKYYMKGLGYCVVCDGPLYKGKDILHIGGGNSSVQEGLYGSSVAKNFYILQNISKLTAEKVIIEQFMKMKNAKIIYNAEVKEILGDEKKVTGIRYSENGKDKTLNVDAIFSYIGFIPNTVFLKGLDITDKDGYVIVNDKMQTKVPGLYSAGDVNSKDVRQLTTAASDGTIAAIESNKFIGTNFNNE